MKGLKLNEQTGWGVFTLMFVKFALSMILSFTCSFSVISVSQILLYSVSVFQKSNIYFHLSCFSITLILPLQPQTLLSSHGLTLFFDSSSAAFSSFYYTCLSLSPCLVHCVCIPDVLLIFFRINENSFFHRGFLFFSLSSSTSKNLKHALLFSLLLH